MDSNRGVSIKIAGYVDLFAMYSVSGFKTWDFANKDVCNLGLMRCKVLQLIVAIHICCMLERKDTTSEKGKIKYNL